MPVNLPLRDPRATMSSGNDRGEQVNIVHMPRSLTFWTDKVGLARRVCEQ